MKKFINFGLTCIVILAAAFFVGCDNGTTSDINPGIIDGTPVTYTLNVNNITVYKGGVATAAAYTLTASDSSSTAGITLTFACNEADCELTVTGNQISAAADATEKPHTFTATAKKNGETVATDTFTVTVEALTYELSVEDISLYPGQEKTIIFTLTASDGNTVGITVDFACEEADCELIIGEDTISAALDAEPGEHEFTATATKNSEPLETAAFTVTVISLDDFEPEGIVFPDMEIYRVGDSEANRTITFSSLLDAEGTEVTHQELFDEVTVTYDSETLTITNDGVIESDAAYEIGVHAVTATAQFKGTPMSPVPFAVTVTKLEFDVKFFDDTEEFTNLAKSVEYGDKVQKPNDPGKDGFTFDDWYTTDALTTPFDFTNTLITGATGIYAKFEPLALRNLVITVTLDSDVELEDGEFIWIAGDFEDQTLNQWGSHDWESYLLEEQSDGTWTTTLENVYAYPTLEYNIYAVKSDTVNDFGIRASDEKITDTTAVSSDEIDYTVTEWFGRIVIVEGNLLEYPKFEPESSWKLADAPGWTVTGLDPTSGSWSEVWLTNDDPKAHTGNMCLTTYHQDSDSYYLGQNDTVTIKQDVNASANGLAAEVKVTLSVWLNQINKNQKDVKLVVGNQEYAITETLTGALKAWQEVSHTFTLTAGDITSGDKVTVGLEFTATTNNCHLYVDDFSFVIVP